MFLGSISVDRVVNVGKECKSIIMVIGFDTYALMWRVEGIDLSIPRSFRN